MAISIFPSTAAEFVSNNFVVDMNDTTNNTADTGGVKQAGPYSMSFSSGDSSFDVYLIDDEGNSVGYSNSTSINASGLFSTVVILGVAQDEVISFTYQGSVNNADGEGDEPGAGAYLESITPSDLPSIDDTATVTGGNFGTNTVFTFESGATVLQAKNASIVSGTEALITRPDGLIEDDAPYDLKAVNPGVPTPTQKDFVLTDAVTAGSDPTWVTTSPLNDATKDVAFSQTLEATDSEGTVVDYSVTAGNILAGLSLDSLTGVLSGTPTAYESTTFTVTATDDGGNETSREFEHSVPIATGGTITKDGGFTYHTFTSSDDFEALGEIVDAEFVLVGGGGGGGQQFDSEAGGGGGGAGGLLSQTITLIPGTQVVTIGGGGSENKNGTDSSFGSLGTATGGGGGGIAAGNDGDDGASGGGGGGGSSGGDGGAANPDAISGLLGFAGGNSDGDNGGGGGGAGEVGGAGFIQDGGDGVDTFSAFATAIGLVFDGGFFAGGGGGGAAFGSSVDRQGDGGGGQGAQETTAATAGEANSGGGGGGGVKRGSGNFDGASGGSGVLIVRYAI